MELMSRVSHEASEQASGQLITASPTLSPFHLGALLLQSHPLLSLRRQVAWLQSKLLSANLPGIIVSCFTHLIILYTLSHIQHAAVQEAADQEVEVRLLAGRTCVLRHPACHKVTFLLCARTKILQHLIIVTCSSCFSASWLVPCSVSALYDMMICSNVVTH